jgi:hypothetical protein
VVWALNGTSSRMAGTAASRTVSIDAGMVQVLREHRADQAEERLAAGDLRSPFAGSGG